MKPASEWLAVVKFLLLGGAAAAVNWLSRFGWSQIMPFQAAVAAAYLTGMVVAFLLFRTFVFPQSPRRIRSQIIGFCLVNAMGFTLTWSLSLLFVKVLFPAAGFTFHAEAIGHGLAIAAPAATSWFGHKHLTFAGHVPPSKASTP